MNKPLIQAPVKQQGWWDGEPIWRDFTAREKLIYASQNYKLPESFKKGLNFIADCIDVKVRNIQ